jgi:uncharacterized protein
MFVCALRIEIHIPHAHSLKERRAVVKPLTEGIRNRHPVAVAEVGFQDKWQRAALGIAAVGSSEGQVTELLDTVERFVWSWPEIEVGITERTWME